jgi:hypothetical protein
MRVALAIVMVCNAMVFFFAAALHAGISIGRFHEPYILPATIVEVICGAALAWGAASILTRSRNQWRAALVGNVVALGGVLLGKAALAAGKGPRTASNDLYHNLMLILIPASIIMLVSARPAFHRKQSCASSQRRCPDIKQGETRDAP